MPQSSRRGARAPHEIVSLARKWMGHERPVYHAPSIPPLKEASARLAHTLHLPESEPILVLYDGTLFGSAENGFVVTAERLCWKNLFEHPRQIAWGEIDPASVTPADGAIRVAGGRIVVTGDLVASGAAFLAEVAARHALGQPGPYRAGAELPHEPTAGVEVAPARLIAIARAHVGEVEGVYYQPGIPPAKLRRARAAHARHLGPGEEIVVLYDDTVFGSAEEGFALTPRRLCWKNLTGEAEAAAWTAIEPEAVKPVGNLVYVTVRSIQLTTRIDRVAPAAAMIAAIAREARAEAPPA